jgi:hypothetical protein
MLEMATSPKGSSAASATVHDQEHARGAGGELHQFAGFIGELGKPRLWAREPPVKMS